MRLVKALQEINYRHVFGAEIVKLIAYEALVLYGSWPDNWWHAGVNYYGSGYFENNFIR